MLHNIFINHLFSWLTKSDLVIISCSTCCLVGLVKATWVCASVGSNLVIISSSTCCLVGPVKATWICASFDSNLVIISCSTCCLVGPVKAIVLQLMMTRLESKLAQTHVASKAMIYSFAYSNFDCCPLV